MDLVATQTALVAWVASLSGLAAAAVVFEDDPRPITQDGAMALLSWVSDVGVGIDEVRWIEDTSVAIPHANLTPAAVGDRAVVLQVSFETITSAPGGPNARALCSRFRDRLQMPSSQAALEAAKLGLASASAVTTANYGADEHIVNRALCDVHFNATSFETDDAGVTGSLESVDVTSTFADVDGTALPAAEQMNHEVIP